MSGKLFFIEYNLRLFFWLLFRNFDIYCAIDLDTILPIYINTIVKRKPCVYDAHEYYTELPEIVDRPAIQKFWKFVARCTLPHIRYNYTVSNAIAGELSEKYKQPYGVIRNVPALNSNTATSGIKQKIILYQGAFNKGRGLEELIDAMEFVDAQLILAGTGDLSAQIRHKAESKDYRHKIEFAGVLTPEKLKQLTSDALIGINLIAPLGLSYFYSLSNKFFDYIHAGIPQICMNYPEYAEINKTFSIAVLINDLDKSTIAEAINLLITDSALYDRI
ncbi:MAG: glycosyltransferase, partial [Chitinophagales bacterium]